MWNWVLVMVWVCWSLQAAGWLLVLLSAVAVDGKQLSPLVRPMDWKARVAAGVASGTALQASQLAMQLALAMLEESWLPWTGEARVVMGCLLSLGFLVLVTLHTKYL